MQHHVIHLGKRTLWFVALFALCSCMALLDGWWGAWAFLALSLVVMLFF